MKTVGCVCLVVLLSACGRQVTPDIPGVGVGGLSPGYMSVKFDVAGPMNFTNYEYIVAFNTTGSNLTPGTNTPASWGGYSYAIVVGGNAGSTYANAYEYFRSPGQAQPSLNRIGTTFTQLQYVANSNGAYTEFTVTFARTIFQGLQPTGTATPPPVANTWTFNGFTGGQNALGTWSYLDSLGVGGGNSAGPQFVSPSLDVTQAFDTFAPALNGTPPSDQAAQIVSIEIANNP